MQNWLGVYILLVILVVDVVILSGLLIRTCVELERLRRVAREQRSTLLRVRQLASQAQSVGFSQGFGPHRSASLTNLLEVTESPSRHWSSVATV